MLHILILQEENTKLVLPERGLDIILSYKTLPGKQQLKRQAEEEKLQREPRRGVYTWTGRARQWGTGRRAGSPVAPQVLAQRCLPDPRQVGVLCGFKSASSRNISCLCLYPDSGIDTVLENAFCRHPVNSWRRVGNRSRSQRALPARPNKRLT